MKFRRYQSHGITNHPDPDRIESFLHKIGIQKVSLKYTGKVELKSGSVETELESMEKKIDHM